ncbi:alpha-E domain-containing protein [Rubripirellula amarantea]|nr:alpha-E domain-containing protein [Rubripirellula amarantea]
MLSRVAESIYWMSRQIERAENLARFLEVTHNLILDQPENLLNPWKPLVQVTADNEAFDERFKEANADTVTQFLAFDDTYVNSMLSSLRQARENARGVRESLSSEAFEQINDFYRFVRDASNQASLESPNDFFDAVRRIAIQWTGVLDSTMPRDMGWHFANVGRLLERADKTSRILDVKYFNILPQVDDVGTAVDDLQWSALLSAISGVEAYRRQHHLISIEHVVEFFLFNHRFPRSITFCLFGMCESLAEIQGFSNSDSEHTTLPLAKALHDRLVSTDVQQVLSTGMHQFIDSLQTELNQIGAAMNHDYFHSAVPS